MKYKKPEIEVIKVDSDIMASANLSTALTAIQSSCGGYNGGDTNNFTCSDFGGYNASNPPAQNAQVTIGGGTYVYDYKGNHWKLHKGN